MTPAKLFIPNLPRSMSETRLRGWLKNDPEPVISFTHLGEDKLALIETISTADAERLVQALEKMKTGAGRQLQIIRGESEMGQRLSKLFLQLRRHEFATVGSRVTCGVQH